MKQLGKYTLQRKIAVGGMAEIHLAEQTGPGGFKKQLVIKKILPHLVGDQKFLQMFQNEARVAAMMSHPNIVQIFDLGEEDSNNFFIAMEYVSGFTLREIIQSSNDNGMWLAPEYIAKLGSQICEGLEYAHNFCDSEGNHLNFIHRDVSPQNLILSNQGIIKIVDFGIAKTKSNMLETQAGIIKGKLAYMSPEQVKGLFLDRRSDLFSLGIVLYELSTHHRPFYGKSDIDMLRAILESGPTAIENIRNDFPADLSHIIYRALAKDREERYSSSRELQWDLDHFLQKWGKPIGPFQLQELIRRIELLKKSDQQDSSPSSSRDLDPNMFAKDGRGVDDTAKRHQWEPTSPTSEQFESPALYEDLSGYSPTQDSLENMLWDDDGEETMLNPPHSKVLEKINQYGNLSTQKSGGLLTIADDSSASSPRSFEDSFSMNYPSIDLISRENHLRDSSLSGASPVNPIEISNDFKNVSPGMFLEEVSTSTDLNQLINRRKRTFLSSFLSFLCFFFIAVFVYFCVL